MRRDDMITTMASVRTRSDGFAWARSALRAASSDRVFIALLLLAALLASALRFSNLEKRVLWGDENITVLRSAGYTETDFARVFLDGRTHEIKQMRVYQGFGSDRSAYAVMRSLAIEDPQHPPLYYLMLHFWQRTLGASVAVQRLLSVVIGIALIPAMYWLCMELFGSRRTAVIGAALTAVSPFFFAYSHELREYGLFALCALLSQALLLRIQRKPSGLSWSIYALCLAAGLYADLFFVLILIADGVYFLLARENRAFIFRGFFAILAAVLLYVPWIMALLLHTESAKTMNSWSAVPWPLKMLAEKWVFDSGAAFFDLEWNRIFLGVVLVPIFLALLYAFVHVARNAGATPKRFLGALFVSTILLFFASDLVLHAHRSAITRYGTASYITLLLFMTAMLGYETGRARRIAAQIATLALVAGGLTCCVIASQKLVWWDNHGDDEIIPIAIAINSAEHPLLLAPTPWQRIYLLSFRLRDDVRVVFPVNGKPLKAVQPTFLVATQDDVNRYAGRLHQYALQQVYTARYSEAWEAFHRPLQRGQFVNADGAKLSLWRIRAAAGIPAMNDSGPGSLGAYTYHGCVVYGRNDWFSTNLRKGGSSYASSTVDPDSAAMIANFVAAYPGAAFNINGTDVSVRLQYGPVNVATATTPLYSVQNLVYGFADDPWNDNPKRQIPWERGFLSQGSCVSSNGDCHSVVMTSPAGGPPGTRPCIDYETYNYGAPSFDGTGFTAKSLTVRNLKRPFNDQYTSKPGPTMAGLPVLGTVDLGEDAVLPSINHIAMLVLPGTDGSKDTGNCATMSCASGGFVAPANAGPGCASHCRFVIPFGARLRLNPAKYTCPDEFAYPQAHKICVQLQTYGAIVTDHGSPGSTFGIPLGPSSDGSNPWKQGDVQQLNGIPLTAFDVMKLERGRNGHGT